MVTLTVGSVILVNFPFSDLSRTKLRPAVVLADYGKGDWVLCQITSKPYGDPHSIELHNASFATGSLHLISYVRPGKLFTANRNLALREIGKLKDDALEQIVVSIVALLRRSLGP